MAAAVVNVPQPPSPPPPPRARPRLISEAPSARNLKPCRVSAVRRWPPGCGRFPAPPAAPSSPAPAPAPAPAPSPPAPSPPAPSPTTNPPAPDPSPVPLPVQIPSSSVVLAATQTVVADSHHASPPPPPPTHSDPLLTEIKDNKDKGKRWMTSTFYPPPKRRSVSAVRRYPPGCGRDPHFSLSHFKTDTTSTSDHHISPQISIPVPPHDAHHDVQTAAHHDHKEQLTENTQIHQPDTSPAQGNTTFDTKCEPLTMLQDQLLDAPTAQPHIPHTPNTQATSDAKVALNMDSHTSKEIVVALECVPLKEKEKVVLKKKVVAKKNTSPKSGQIASLKKTRLVPSQICDHEDASMDPSTTDPIPLSQRSPQVCPKKSVALSQPRPADGKMKKKGSRVAKKSTRPVKDDNPSAQQHNSMTLTLLPVIPFDGEKLSNARHKVKKVLRLFQMICRVLLQKEESGSDKLPQKDLTGSESKSKGPNRIDLKAVDIVKRSSEYVDPGNPVVGHLPGVEVGDEFRYRVELHLIGLHRPLQSGIDWTKVNGVPVATSIVASGGYSDGMDGSDVLIYTGSGGKPTGRKGQRTLPEDQKLEKGNVALKNSMDMKTPVRVIHGLNTSDTRKVLMTFTYDGLYMVEEFKQEPEKQKIDGKEYITQVFKYKLKRMVGQPELGLHVATKSKKSKVREGLCVPDISQGKEKIPICAINTIDDEKPPAFKYVTSIIYPSWYKKTAPKGCDCTGKCSSSKRCLCALKNGGEIPFNFNGAIVQAKPLIYECGPSCRCPPSCHNRVSQSGIKIPLEIFKTETRGWGVRSLSSIQSGSFVCEYVGELLRDEEAEKRGNDEYLFDIGHNYDDAALWEGLPSFVPGIGSTSSEDSRASVSEGFTIDAAEMGNVGRFINHSCSPNLYAQNVLFDRDDRRMPHIMFFAAENIPPLQELTYHYNYTIGEVRDSQGNEKVKKCYCGSLECEGRLY